MTKTPTATGTATPTSTPPVVPPGSSLRLNGTSAYAQTAPDPALSPASWTFEVWFKDANPTYDHPRTRILTNGDISGREVPYFASIDRNLLYVGLRSGGTPYLFNLNLKLAKVTPNAWHHLAASFSASTRMLTIYIDGEQRVQGGFDAVSTGTNLPLIVGRSGTVGDYWNGNLDDLRLWNVARSAAEIKSNYQTEIIGTPPGLVGNWHFNEGSGNMAHDSAPPPQDLELFGGAGWQANAAFVLTGSLNLQMASIPAGAAEGLGADDLNGERVAAAAYPEIEERVVFAAGRSSTASPAGASPAWQSWWETVGGGLGAVLGGLKGSTPGLTSA